MIHELASAVGISDGLASALITAFSIMFVAIIGLLGIMVKNGFDVRTIRRRVTSDIEDRRHAQNTHRFVKLEKGQKEQKTAITRIEDKLEIEHTFVPEKTPRKRATK